MVDGRLEVLYFSEGIPMLFALDASGYRTLIADDAFAIVLDCDREYLKRRVRACLETSDEVDCTYRIHHRGQGFLWIRCRSRVVGERDGHPVLLSIFSAASAATVAYEMLLDRSERIVYVCDAHTYELYYANRAALDRWGHDDFAGRTCYGFIHDRIAPCPWCSYLEMQDDALHLEDRYDRGSGRYLDIGCSRVSWFGREAYCTFVDDVTDDHESRSHLEEERGELADIIENIPAGLCVFRGDGEEFSLVAMNDALRDIADVSRSEIAEPLQTTIARRLHPDDREQASRIMTALTKGPGEESCVLRLRGKHRADYIWLQLHVRSVRRPDGSLMVFACETDVTEKKETENALRRESVLYEAAVKQARLSVWEYDIISKRIVIPDKDSLRGPFATSESPRTITDVPGFLERNLEPQSAERLMALYEDLERGAGGICEVWQKFLPGRPAHCLRVSMFVDHDGGDRPAKAYCMAQDITAEKGNEYRYLRALEYSQAERRKGLVAKARCNLTRNTVPEHTVFADILSDMSGDDLYDSMVERYADAAADDTGRGEILAALDRRDLMQRCIDGDMQRTVEYLYSPEDGDPLSCRVVVDTFPVLPTGEIEAFLCVYEMA